VQRYRCQNCSATFSETRPRVGNHLISVEKAEQIIALMLEGMSIRGISRVTGTDQNTIMSLLLTVGERCRRVFNVKVRGIKARYLELDELWNFTFKKQKQVCSGDPSEWGDTYTWFGLDAQSKMIVSYLVAKRDGPSALEFVTDLSKRVVGRVQITSDGFKPYIGAVEESFGCDADFAQLIKVFGKADNAGPDWYGPPKVIETVPTPVSGNPDLDHISTSFVERANLNVRMHLRRFTRLTNAFSKKLSHLKAAVDLYALWHNLCRVHQTLRATPAMQAGITDHVWSIREMLGAGA
jgi:hypothetical protein